MSYYGNCELHKAIETGDHDAAQALLAAGSDVNAVCWIDIYNYTPLILAADTGNVDLVRLLLQHGALVDAVNFNRCPALGFALCKGHIAVAELLVQAGADIHVRVAENNMTLLMGIVACGPPRSVQFLVDLGADVNAPDAQGKTPLSWTDEDSQEIAQILRSKGAI